MASTLAATTVWEVEGAGASTNGAGFNTGATFTADLTCTSGTGNSPVVASASYNFASGDVGAWLFISAGTNWLTGWYKIASVASNAATLSAAIGAAIASATYAISTVAGCSTVATQSSNKGTWTIDYSQQAAYQVTGTVTNASTTVTATTSIFTPAMIGNFISDGTTYAEITAYTSGTIVTCARSSATISWTAATVYVGGAASNPSQVLAVGVASNAYWIKYNSSAYTFSANPTINAGSVAPSTTVAPNWLVGYNTTRGDIKGNASTDPTRPTIAAASSCTIILNLETNGWWVQNLILDSATVANECVYVAVYYVNIFNVLAKNFKLVGIYAVENIGTMIEYCEVTGGTSAATAGISTIFTDNIIIDRCFVHDNACIGVSLGNGGGSLTNSIVNNNTGASSTGVTSGYGNSVIGNTIGNNGSDCVQLTGSVNCIIKGNILYGAGKSSGTNASTAYGINFSAGSFVNGNNPLYDGNAYYNNKTANRNNCGTGVLDVILSASPFISSSNFALNNTAGGGLACYNVSTAFPGGNTTSYAVMGAVVPQVTSGGLTYFTFGGVQQ